MTTIKPGGNGGIDNKNINSPMLGGPTRFSRRYPVSGAERQRGVANGPTTPKRSTAGRSQLSRHVLMPKRAFSGHHCAKTLTESSAIAYTVSISRRENDRSLPPLLERSTPPSSNRPRRARTRRSPPQTFFSIPTVRSGRRKHLGEVTRMSGTGRPRRDAGGARGRTVSRPPVAAFTPRSPVRTVPRRYWSPRAGRCERRSRRRRGRV